MTRQEMINEIVKIFGTNHPVTADFTELAKDREVNDYTLKLLFDAYLELFDKKVS